jgi:hypothetical protein
VDILDINYKFNYTDLMFNYESNINTDLSFKKINLNAYDLTCLNNVPVNLYIDMIKDSYNTNPYTGYKSSNFNVFDYNYFIYNYELLDDTVCNYNLHILNDIIKPLDYIFIEFLSTDEFTIYYNISDNFMYSYDLYSNCDIITKDFIPYKFLKNFETTQTSDDLKFSREEQTTLYNFNGSLFYKPHVIEINDLEDLDYFDSYVIFNVDFIGIDFSREEAERIEKFLKSVIDEINSIEIVDDS